MEFFVIKAFNYVIPIKMVFSNKVHVNWNVILVLNLCTKFIFIFWKQAGGHLESFKKRPVLHSTDYRSSVPDADKLVFFFCRWPFLETVLEQSPNEKRPSTENFKLIGIRNWAFVLEEIKQSWWKFIHVIIWRVNEFTKSKRTTVVCQNW